MFAKFLYRLMNNRYIREIKKFVSDPKGYFAVKKFVRLMNLKAKEMNMNNSRFYNPSGAFSRSFSTVLDLSNLCQNAINYDFIVDMWITDNKKIKIEGPNSRLLTIENIVMKNCIPQLKGMLVGGKSGSWVDKYKAHIFYLRIENCKYILSILANDEISFKNVYKIAYEICTNSFNNTLGYYTKTMIDNNGGFLLKNIETNEFFCKNENLKNVPASVTKVLTAICTLESGLNLNTPVKISQNDILDGSGSEFISGDVIPLSDALHIMILESSNTMANAIARTVGLHI